MSQVLSLAICQLTSIDDSETNFQQMSLLVRKAKRQNPNLQIAFFPENCLYMRVKEGEAIPGFSLEDRLFSKLAELATELQVDLHLGSVPLRRGQSLFNASVFIDRRGVLQSNYQKIHLFDISLEGQKPIRESDVFSRGDAPSVLEYQGWKLGQSICYDLRFAELYSRYSQLAVDGILIPSAFLVKTGQAHWEVLLRARAIESQCYVIAPAQAGQHVGKNGGLRETYGRSLFVGPWGQILAQGSPDQAEVLLVEMQKDLIDQVRRQIPMSGHRRL